jgi:hypothetical protein
LPRAADSQSPVRKEYAFFGVSPSFDWKVTYTFLRSSAPGLPAAGERWSGSLPSSISSAERKDKFGAPHTT